MGFISGLSSNIKKVGSRLKYTVSTLSDVANPLDKDFGKVELKASTKSPTVNKALETVANHPFATAAVAATALSSAGRAAVGAASKYLGTKFMGAGLGTQAAVVLSAPVVTSAVLTKPLETTSAIISYPDKAAQLGADMAELAADPSVKGVKEFVTEHKVASVLTAGAAAIGFSKFIPAISTWLSSHNLRKATDEAAKNFTKPIELVQSTKGMTDAEKKDYRQLKQYVRDLENYKKKGKLSEDQYNTLMGRNIMQSSPLANPIAAPSTPSAVVPVASPIPATVTPPPVSTATVKPKKKRKKAKKKTIKKKKAPKKKKRAKSGKKPIKKAKKRTSKKRKVYKKRKTKKR